MQVNHNPLPFYQKFAYIIVGIAVLGHLLLIGKNVLAPLMFGFLFAILLLPVAAFIEKYLRLPRSIATLITILMLLAFVSCVLYLVGAQLSHLADDWPMLQTQIGQSLNELFEGVGRIFHIDASKEISYIHDTSKKIVTNEADTLGTTLSSVSSIRLFYVLIFIFTFFILLYRGLLIRFIVWVFADEYAATVYRIAWDIQNLLRQYLFGLLLEMVVVASLACTIFWIIGIKYAVLLGLITGLLNLVPYLGILTALLLSFLVTFATASIKETAYVGISITALHILDAKLLLPTIVSHKVKLNALVTLLGFIIGEMLWGISGLILAIPALAVIKIIFDRVEDLKSWGFLLGVSLPGKKSVLKKGAS